MRRALAVGLADLAIAAAAAAAAAVTDEATMLADPGLPGGRQGVVLLRSSDYGLTERGGGEGVEGLRNKHALLFQESRRVPTPT